MRRGFDICNYLMTVICLKGFVLFLVPLKGSIVALKILVAEGFHFNGFKYAYNKRYASNDSGQTNPQADVNRIL